MAGDVRDRPRGIGHEKSKSATEMLPMLSLIPSGRHCDCPRRVFLVWTAFARVTRTALHNTKYIYMTCELITSPSIFSPSTRPVLP
jgi:hypothetical protein